MNGFRLLLVPLILAGMVAPASAGIFFNKRPKANPAERVPTLIATAKTDPEEKKRAAAAAELREFDPAAYPEIIPVLIDLVQNDAKPGVRLEAVQSLAKLRPVSQQVGFALEQAADQDKSLRVRLQARSSLLQYHLAGYRSPKKDEIPAAPSGPKTEEPPLASPLGMSASQKTSGPLAQDPGTPMPRGSVSRTALPRNRPQSPLVPVNPPKLVAPPGPKDDGPDLSPPPSP